MTTANTAEAGQDRAEGKHEDVSQVGFFVSLAELGQQLPTATVLPLLLRALGSLSVVTPLSRAPRLG